MGCHTASWECGLFLFYSLICPLELQKHLPALSCPEGGVGVRVCRIRTLPASTLQVSGVLEMSSSDTMDRLCSAEGLLRGGGGNGEISVSLASCASVSRRRRRLRLLLGVVRDRRDTAFFMAGLSFFNKEKRGKGIVNKIINFYLKQAEMEKHKNQEKLKQDYVCCKKILL